jgi:organic radical activating enzyme
MSKTFCPLPWVHLATHPQGEITLCCEADHTQGISESYEMSELGLRRPRTLHTTNYDFDVIQNSDSFSKVRTQMLNDEEPVQCTRCFDLERVGIKSKRQYELERLNCNEERAIKITNLDGTINDVCYEFIELRLGNHCNLACRSCNPLSTSRWTKHWNEVNPDNPLKVDQELFNWPLDGDFWEELLDYSSELRYIYINGGEPLLIDKHLHFLERLVKWDKAKNITLVYSTNCTVLNHAYEDVWKKFKHVQLMLSIDDLEHRNHFIRYPAKWDVILQTMEWIKHLCEADNISYNIMQTVSIYNILYLKEFHEYFADAPYISLNFVTDPAYLDPATLPQEIKDYICEQFPNETVKNYLTKGESCDTMTEFLTKTLKMDELRKQNFQETFPELYEMVIKHV